MLVYPEQRYAYDPRQMPGAVPVPGPSTYPPQFTYGLQQGWGAHPAMASGATAAAGNIPSALSTVGMVAGLGTMFSASPMLGAMSNLDPTMLGFNVGTARFGAMRAAGMGFGGSLGAGAMASLGPMALAMGAYSGARYTGQQFMAGGREQMQLGQQLSGVGFANSQAMTGRGFGFNQLRQIGEMMREVDAADPFTTMSDLNKSMDQFMDLGMHRGVRDAKEFGKKLTEFAKNARDMARELGTSMEEAGRVIGSMRQSGFYTSADVEGNTRRLQLSKGLGMSTDQFGAMQGQGADIARGSLMRGRAGARTATAMAQDLLVGATSRASGGTGVFTDEQLMDITGAGTGVEAASAMGTQFTGVMTNFLRGPAGRGMLAGLGRQENGAYTGELDQAQLSQFLSGKVRLQDLAAVGGARMTTAKARGSFKTSEHNIASSLLESEQGVEAVMASIQGAAKGYSRGALNEDDEMKLFMERVLGVDARMADAYATWIKNYSKTKDARMRRMREELGAAQLQREVQQNYTLGGLSQQVRGGLSDLWAPVRQVGADFTAGVQQAGQDAFDSVVGLERMQITADTRRASLLRLAGGTATVAAQRDRRLEDFSLGSVAGGQVVAQSMIGNRSAVLQSVAALQMEWTAGQPIKAADVGTAQGQQNASQFIMTPEGQRTQDLLRRARLVYASGNSKEGDRLLEQARGIAGVYLQNLGGASGVRAGEAFEKNFLALVALKSGEEETARDLLTGGTIKSGTYGDLKSAKKAAVSNLRKAGLSSELAEQVAGGGVGAELIIRASQSSAGFDTIQQALRDPALQQNLKGKSGEEYQTAIADYLSKKFGGQYTAADVQQLTRAETEIRQEARSGLGRLGATEETLKLGAASTYFRVGGAGAQRAVDLGVVSTSARSAANVLTGGTEELRKALGPEYEAALETLRAVGVEGKGGAAEQQAAIKALNALLTKADTSGVSGIAGGGELARLGAQQRRGLAAAKQGDLATIASEFGVTEDWIRSKTGGSTSAVDLEKVVSQLSGASALEAMGSGAGGGLFRRGATVEGQLVFDMQRMSESVDKLVMHIDAVTTRPTSGPTMQPDESPRVTSRFFGNNDPPSGEQP